ncbi:hypothetical protein FRC08_010399 [Ceratobasidium sp. 394]|nr:hypothetical protein FRC08_010399 [Ceratobasidium sp. 394]
MPSPVGSTPDNRSTTSKAPPDNGFASQPMRPDAPEQKPLVTAVETLISRDPLEPTIKAPHVLLLDSQQSKTAQTSTEPTYANTELKPQDHPLAPPNMAAVPGPSTRHNPSSRTRPRRTQSWRSSLMRSKTCTLLTSPVHLCLCRARLVHFTHGFPSVPAAHLASYQARQTLKRAPRMTLHPLFGAYAPRSLRMMRTLAILRSLTNGER